MTGASTHSCRWSTSACSSTTSSTSRILLITSVKSRRSRVRATTTGGSRSGYVTTTGRCSRGRSSRSTSTSREETSCRHWKRTSLAAISRRSRLISPTTSRTTKAPTTCGASPAVGQGSAASKASKARPTGKAVRTRGGLSHESARTRGESLVTSTRATGASPALSIYSNYRSIEKPRGYPRSTRTCASSPWTSCSSSYSKRCISTGTNCEVRGPWFCTCKYLDANGRSAHAWRTFSQNRKNAAKSSCERSKNW